MFQVKASKEGSSFTGGLYPEALLETALNWYKKNGYTIEMVSKTN